MTYSFEFADPDVRLNLNGRLHWARRAQITRHWRDAAHVYARWSKAPKNLGPSNVQLTHYVSDPTRKRDPSNWAPTTKAVVDGLTDYGIWPDDDSTHVTVLEPVFERGTPNRTRIDITPRETP